MSFSFNVRAATMAAALVMVDEKVDEVVANQPVHAVDADAIKATARAYADLVEEKEGHDVSINVNGYVSWEGTLGGDEPVTIRGANIGVGIGLIARTD
jgi:hypothetical protein